MPVSQAKTMCRVQIVSYDSHGPIIQPKHITKHSHPCQNTVTYIWLYTLPYQHDCLIKTKKKIQINKSKEISDRYVYKKKNPIIVMYVCASG